jgi:hypothetical protein
MKRTYFLYNINSNTIAINRTPWKILIIEDDSLVKNSGFCLKKEGYEIISRDGADGINQIDILKPDLILQILWCLINLV